MKTFLTIILAGLFAVNVFAQHTANIDFYVGTWKYTNAQTGEEFTLQLRKSFNSVISCWCVVGAYTYKKNGTIITDCMNMYLLQIKENEMPVYATNSRNDPTWVNPNRLDMYVTDYGKFCPNGTNKRSRSNTLELVSSGTPNKVRWILKNDEGDYIASEAPPNDFSIPTDIILTKQ